MREMISLAVILGLLCAQTQAATIITRGSLAARAYGFMKNKAVSSYTGPGDVVSTAKFWIGVRAYNAAYAASAGKAANLRRASDNTACDFNVATSGALGVSASGCSAGAGLSLTSFATTDATCTSGTAAASTTLTLSGCSSTPHVGSSVAGSGFSQPVSVVSVGTFTSGAGTVTLNLPQTVSAVATTLTYGLFITEMYDQTGNGVNAIESTTALQPLLAPVCLNGRPCIDGSDGGVCLAATIVAINQPVTISAVAERVANFTSYAVIALGGFGTYFDATANQVVQYYGAAATATATDGVAHTFEFSSNGTATSFIMVDGSSTPGNPSTGSFPSASTIYFIGDNASCNSTYKMTMTEVGAWASAFSSTQATNMCHNQRLYWGTGGSC